MLCLRDVVPTVGAQNVELMDYMNPSEWTKYWTKNILCKLKKKHVSVCTVAYVYL